MEVLKEGRKQRGWTIEQVCTGKGGGCGALLLVSEKDLYKTYRGHSESENKRDFLNFTCPCCGTENEMADEVDIPSSVREKIPDKRDFFERLKK